MASATINIRCQNREIAEKLFDEIIPLLEEVAHQEGLDIDSNYDSSKVVYKTVKVTEKSYENVSDG